MAEPARRSRVKTTRRRKKVFKHVLLMLIVVGVICVGVLGAIIKSYIDAAPPLDLSRIENQNETSFFYDQDGKAITEYFGYENRVWATLEEIPDDLENAFIAVEDKRFRYHCGVDFVRLAGAFLNNLRGGSLQGASTLTQQLIKNCFLSPERTYKRKIQEAYLALKLEQIYNKDQILEAYLNTIYLGEANYGVKAAAMDYFGKENLNDLTLKECAVLAGITKNPSLYNPRRNFYGGKDRREITERRGNLVLSEMLENGFITEAEYEKAKAQKINVQKEATRLKLYDMAPFIEYALYEVRDALIKAKGWTNDEEGRQKAEEYIYSNGLKIYTTVDRDIQKAVEDTLYNWERYPQVANAKDRELVAGDSKIPQPQAAAVVIDYRTGHIKAIVGGRTPPKNKRELNRAVMPVMVGSTIKPIAVYGPALEKGKSPASIYHNIPVTIKGWDSKQKFPKNYGGGGYTGPTSMRYGLMKSLNIVAAQALTYDVGFESSKDFLIQLGIDKEHIQVNGSGLALGTSSITPLELTGAYGAVANGGIYMEPISVLKVLDREGKVIIDRTQNQLKRCVFQESTAWMLIDMMKDAVANGTGKNAQIPGITVAGKTGTNTEFKGVVFAGFTPYYAGVVWVGHDQGKPLKSGSQGGKDAAPIWQTFMAKIHGGKSLVDKPIMEKGPEDLGLVKKKICKVSGKLASRKCPSHDIVVDWFTPQSVPTEYCARHETLEFCKESGKFPNRYCPAQAIERKTVYFLEPDSPYRQLTKEQILKWLPEAYTEFDSIEDIHLLNPDNPEHSQYFCEVHTPPDPTEQFEDVLERLKEFFEKFRQKDKGDKTGDPKE